MGRDTHFNMSIPTLLVMIIMLESCTAKVCETTASDRMREVQLIFQRTTHTDIDIGFGTHVAIQCIEYDKIQTSVNYCNDLLNIKLCDGTKCYFVPTGFTGVSRQSTEPLRWFIRASAEHMQAQCLPLHYRINIVSSVEDKSEAPDSSVTLMIVFSIIVGIVLCVCIWVMCCKLKRKIQSKKTTDSLQSVQIPIFEKSPLTKSGVYSVRLTSNVSDVDFTDGLFTISSERIYCLKPDSGCESVISDLWCDPCLVTLRFMHHTTKDKSSLRVDDYSLRVITNTRLDGILRRWENGQETTHDVVFEKETESSKRRSSSSEVSKESLKAASKQINNSIQSRRRSSKSEQHSTVDNFNELLKSPVLDTELLGDSQNRSSSLSSVPIRSTSLKSLPEDGGNPLNSTK